MEKEKVLQNGMTVNILENHKVIDRALVLSAAAKEVSVRSLQLYPGEAFDFAMIDAEGKTGSDWIMLFKDPFSGGRCFSERAPSYALEPE